MSKTTTPRTKEQTEADAIAFRSVQHFIALCKDPSNQPNLSFHHIELLRMAISDVIVFEASAKRKGY